ncbi:transcriptional repressor TCF25-domain-containing protein [Gorgonomyces haynaldii]|nr:transcriptional repressor TCF25-domain-containing protein [Gorgonomyces haynaldii]
MLMNSQPDEESDEESEKQEDSEDEKPKEPVVLPVSKQKKIEKQLTDDEILELAFQRAQLQQVELKQETKEEPLLKIDPKHLDGDQELRRQFGSVIDDQVNKRIKRKRTILVNPVENWPRFNKEGVSMERDQNGKWQFVHSKSYQKMQIQFMQCVETLNPDTIVGLLRQHPYHIDSLLQLSQVFRHQGELNQASDFVERALFAYERALAPSFKIHDGETLDYNRIENRPLFMALFWHIHFLARRGTWRTCLEFNKLLYGLDPTGDPLCAGLFMDCFAIKAKEFQWLLKFGQDRTMGPGFLYSLAMAQYETEKEHSKSTEMLVYAIEQYPGLVTRLFQKMSLSEPWMTNHYFVQSSQNDDYLGYMTILYDLYVEEMHTLWKVPFIVEWLKSAVEIVLKGRMPVPETKDLKIPLNLQRMLFVADKHEYRTRLPQQLSTVMSYDPYPPPNSIPSVYDYVRNQRNPSTMTIPQTAGALEAFIQSFLPWLRVADGPQDGDQRGLRDMVMDLLNQVNPAQENQENEEQ